MIMTAAFAAGLLFVWRHSIARWVVGGLLMSVFTTMFILPAMGLTILSGLVALMHVIFWSPGLYLLLTKRPFLQDRSAFAIWSGVITGVILFSFVFDIRDAAIYLHHVLF